MKQELYIRAITLSRGTRSISGTGAAANEQGADIAGMSNERANAEMNACIRGSDSVRDRLLSLYTWEFARRSSVLEERAGSSDGWEYGYKVPDDCMKVISVQKDGASVEYEALGDVVYCNAEYPVLKYTGQVSDVRRWPGAFADVFAYSLAQEIVLATTGNAETVQLLEQKTQILIQTAIQTGAIRAEIRIPLKEELYNRAITLLKGSRTIDAGSAQSMNAGADFTGDLTHRTREETAVCRRSGAEVRDRLFELYSWSFAKTEAVFPDDVIPPDCMKIAAVLVDGVPVEYGIADGKILHTGNKDVTVRYIKKVEDVEKWPAVFREVYCYCLAVEVGLAIGADMQVLAQLREHAAGLIAESEESGAISEDIEDGTKDGICSRAVALSGAKLYKASAEDETDYYREALKVCSRSYAAVRDRALSMYAWTFARKRAEMASGDELPKDCVNVLAVLDGDRPCDWDIVNGKLRCSGHVVMHYTAHIVDSSQWDALFVDVMTYLLAEEIVTSTTRDTGTFQMLEQKVSETVSKAYQQGKIQNMTKVIPEKEIYRRAINLVHGTRTVQPSSEVSASGGSDVLGSMNDRAESEYRACELGYENVRDYLLEAYAWVFARKSVQLEATEESIKGWRWGYKLPEDCVNVLTVLTEKNDERPDSSLRGYQTEPVEWEVSGRNLYAMYQPVTIRYTSKAVDADYYPASFVEVIVYMLAIEVMRATQGMNEVTQSVIEGLQGYANKVISDSQNMGLIRNETQIPPRYEICRRAMGLVKGLIEVRSQQNLPDNEGLAVCLRNFSYVRDRVLQLYPWVFARRTGEPMKTGEHVAGWRYVYRLPPDCLKVVAVASRGYDGHEEGVEVSEYEVAGTELYANREVIYLRYTGKIHDLRKWAPAYTDAFCVMLAKEIAMSLSMNADAIKILENQFMEIINTANENGLIKAETGLHKRDHRLPSEYGRSLSYSLRGDYHCRR